MSIYNFTIKKNGKYFKSGTCGNGLRSAWDMFKGFKMIDEQFEMQFKELNDRFRDNGD